MKRPDPALALCHSAPPDIAGAVAWIEQAVPVMPELLAEAARPRRSR